MDHPDLWIRDADARVVGAIATHVPPQHRRSFLAILVAEKEIANHKACVTIDFTHSIDEIQIEVWQLFPGG